MAKYWTRELAHAFDLHERGGLPRPFPVKVAETELPDSLSRFHYLDATQSLANVESELRSLARSFRPKAAYDRLTVPEFLFTAPHKRRPPAKRVASEAPTRHLSIYAISIEVHQTTEKYFGGAGNGITEQEVRREQLQQQTAVLEQTRGILTNFVQEAAITDAGGVVLIQNGELQLGVDEVVGPLPGSLRKRTTATGVLISPDKRRVVKALPSKIASLGADAVEYAFRLDPALSTLGARILAHLRDRGAILSQATNRVVGRVEGGCEIRFAWSLESLRLRIPAECLPAFEPIGYVEVLTGYQYG